MRSPSRHGFPTYPVGIVRKDLRAEFRFGGSAQTTPEVFVTEVRKRPTVAIVGAGAAGTLTAVQLCETATRRRTPSTWCWSTRPRKQAAAPPTPPLIHATGSTSRRAA